MARSWKRFIALLGPGIFAIGYSIGTGSVTAMAKAGSQYGLRLLWVLALSCVFSGFLMEAYGRFAVVTGETSLHGIRRHLPGGKAAAIAILIGVVTAQYTCLGGILALSSGAVYETLGLFFRAMPQESYWASLSIAVVLIAVIYALLINGRYSFFEKVLVFFVTLMGATFIISMFVVWPSPEILKQAVVPSIPQQEGALLMIASFVGTTMCAPTFVTRPLLLKEKGLTADNLTEQRVDAVVSVTLMFVISGSIMTVAAGALYAHGKEIVKILDMARTLSPLAGRAAVALFMSGTVCAGLSSIFPILMVAPLLLSDYRAGRMETRTRSFKLICLAACALGLVVPALGRNPISITIMAQVANVFVLPLTVLAIVQLVNRKDLMGDNRAGLTLNAGLALAFAFSCVIAATGVRAILVTLKSEQIGMRTGRDCHQNQFLFYRQQALVLQHGFYGFPCGGKRPYEVAVISDILDSVQQVVARHLQAQLKRNGLFAQRLPQKQVDRRGHVQTELRKKLLRLCFDGAVQSDVEICCSHNSPDLFLDAHILCHCEHVVNTKVVA